MKFKLMALMLSLCMVLAMLSGCGADTADTSAISDAPTSAESVSKPAEEESTMEAVAESSEQPEEPTLPVYDLPLTTEPVAFTFWTEGASPTVAATLGDEASYNSSDATRYLEDYLGVSVEYVEYDMMSGSEKFNLMIASEEYCDLMCGFDDSYAGGSQLGYEQDIILELTDLIADMPYYSAYLEQNPDWKKLTISDDGNSYFIASLCYENYTQQGGCIRQDWLDALELDIPTTYDQLTEVAKAFKAEYNSTATIYLTRNYNPMLAFSGGLGLPAFDFTVTGSGFYQIDGEIQCVYVRDEFKEMIQLYRQWYELGLISPDFFSVGGGGDAQSAINNGMVGISWNRAESITDYNAQLADTGFQFAGFPNLVQEEGQVIHFAPEQAGIVRTYAVSAGCENLDVLAKFLDWGFTDEGILWGNYGMEGYSYDINDAGEPEFTEAMFDRNVGFKQSSERYMRYNLPTIKDIDCAFPGMYDEIGLAAVELWNSNYDGAYDLPTTMSITPEEGETYTALITDVETSMQEWVLKATTGDVDLDAEWDSYVEMLYDYGLQECIDIQQASYERFQNR